MCLGRWKWNIFVDKDFGVRWSTGVKKEIRVQSFKLKNLLALLLGGNIVYTEIQSSFIITYIVCCQRNFKHVSFSINDFDDDESLIQMLINYCLLFFYY